MLDKECPEAAEQFVERLGSCQDRLFAYILMLLSNRDAALDVLQETNLVLWRKAAEFDRSRTSRPGPVASPISRSWRGTATKIAIA